MNDNAYQKVADYSTVYADGIVWRLEKDVCRLMLYQESIEPTKEGDMIERYEKRKVLKYEVRIPRETFRNLCAIGGRVLVAADKSDEITEGIQDDKVDEAYWKFNDHISELIFDTEAGYDSKEIEQVDDNFDDLVGRVNAIRPVNRALPETEQSTKDN